MNAALQASRKNYDFQNIPLEILGLVTSYLSNREIQTISYLYKGFSKDLIEQLTNQKRIQIEEIFSLSRKIVEKIELKKDLTINLLKPSVSTLKGLNVEIFSARSRFLEVFCKLNPDEIQLLKENQALKDAIDDVFPSEEFFDLIDNYRSYLEIENFEMKDVLRKFYFNFFFQIKDYDKSIEIAKKISESTLFLIDSLGFLKNIIDVYRDSRLEARAENLLIETKDIIEKGCQEIFSDPIIPASAKVFRFYQMGFWFITLGWYDLAQKSLNNATLLLTSVENFERESELKSDIKQLSNLLCKKQIIDLNKVSE